MNTRRSFFKQFGATIAAVALIQGVVKNLFLTGRIDDVKVFSTVLTDEEIQLYHRLPLYFIQLETERTPYKFFNRLFESREFPVNMGATNSTVWKNNKVI